LRSLPLGGIVRFDNAVFASLSSGKLLVHGEVECGLKHGAVMSNYEQGKKARRIASVVFLLIMVVILGGTYLSEQQKAAIDGSELTL